MVITDGETVRQDISTIMVSVVVIVVLEVVTVVVYVNAPVIQSIPLDFAGA